MPRDYWQSCWEFLPGFSWRVAVFLIVVLAPAVGAWKLIAAYLPMGIGDTVPPGTFWGAIGLGTLWAAVATYHDKASNLATVEETPANSADAWDRDAYRAQKIQEWRELVEALDGRTVLKMSEWSQMRVHLKDSVVQEVEDPDPPEPRWRASYAPPDVKETILDGLAELEERWGLL